MSEQPKQRFNRLKESRVLVIGGSSGMGYAVAEACVESGSFVIISASTPESADKALKKLQNTYPAAANRISALSCNLQDAAALEANIANLFQAVSKDGKLDHIVFTAGDKTAEMPIANITLAAAQQAGVVRYFTPMLVAKYAMEHLKKSRESSFTLTSGVAGQKPGSGWLLPASYAGGINSMAKALATGMMPVRVNAVAPGPVNTPLWRMTDEQKEMALGYLKTKTATGEVGSPEDVAETYLGVLKDWNCTGTVIETNSGFLLI